MPAIAGALKSRRMRNGRMADGVSLDGSLLEAGATRVGSHACHGRGCRGAIRCFLSAQIATILDTWHTMGIAAPVQQITVWMTICP